MAVTLTQSYQITKRPSPALAFAQLIWRCSRWFFAAMAAQLLLTALIVHFSQVGIEWKWVAVISNCWSPLFLIVLFTNLDLSPGAGSNYQSYLLCLPLRTSTLAFWPMAYGALTMAVLWVLSAQLLILPMGYAVPLIWPSLLLAAFMIGVQTISWAPIGWLRIPLGIIVCGAINGFGSYGYIHALPHNVMCGVYLAVIAVVAVCNPIALSNARRGDSIDWSRLQKYLAYANLSRVIQKPRNAFRSAQQAQVWCEWRGYGFLSPLMVAIVFTVSLLGLADPVKIPLTILPIPVLAGIQVRSWIGIFLLQVLYIPFVGFNLTGDFQKENRKKDLSLTSFYATRPLTNSDMVRAKLHMTLRSTLTIWAIVALFISASLLIPATEGSKTAPLGLILLNHMTARLWALILVTLATMVFWTWKSNVESLAFVLSGRTWVMMSYAILWSCGMGACISLGLDAYFHPVRTAHIIKFLPEFMGMLTAIKVALAVWVLSTLRKRNMVSSSFLGKAGIAWALCAASFYALGMWLMPHGLMPNWQLVATIILFLPVVRISLAPLALAWNRHR